MTIAALTSDALREAGPASPTAREVLQLEKLNELVAAVNAGTGGSGIVVISASLTGSVDNWAPTGYATATTVDITSSTGSYNITGYDGSSATSGYLVRILNRSGQTLTLKHNSGSSSSGNKFICIGSADVTLVDGGSAWFHKVSGGDWHQVGLLSTTWASLRVTSLVADGATFNGTTTFNNGPAGINTYDGTYLEWTEEFLVRNAANNTNFGTAGLQCVLSGGSVNADVNTTGIATGIQQLSTAASATGSASYCTNRNMFDMAQMTQVTWEWVGGIPTLSTSSEEFSVTLGLADTNGLNPTRGAWFLYDRANGATSGVNPSNLNKWQCFVKGASTVRVLLDGTSQNGSGSAGSITTVDSPVAATTWPSTNVIRLKIVMTASSVAFYVNNTLRTTLTTGIPTSTHRFGVVGNITKSVGSTARTLDNDWLRYSVTLNGARP